MKKENLENAIKLRHELHEHPELSNYEIWAKNHLMEFLGENTGLEIVDRGRWFYAVYRSEKGNQHILSVPACRGDRRQNQEGKS